LCMYHWSHGLLQSNRRIIVIIDQKQSRSVMIQTQKECVHQPLSFSMRERYAYAGKYIFGVLFTAELTFLNFYDDR